MEGASPGLIDNVKAIYQDQSGCWKTCMNDCKDHSVKSSSEATLHRRGAIHLERHDQIFSRALLFEKCELLGTPIMWTGLYWDHGEGTGYSGWPLRTVNWMVKYYHSTWHAFEGVYSFTSEQLRKIDHQLDSTYGSTSNRYRENNNLSAHRKNIALLSMPRSSSSFASILIRSLTQYISCGEIVNPDWLKDKNYSNCQVPHSHEGM